MQTIVSIFLNLWLVNMQNLRFVASMNKKLHLNFKKDFLREVSNLLTGKMNF